MKFLNKSIVAAVLGLSIVGVAKADEIFLTGSTSARAAVYDTMINPGSVFTAAPIQTLFGGKGSGDTFMAFTGTLVGGTGTTTINCDWSGSEAGIVDVATTGGKTETFMADSVWSATVAPGNGDPSGSPASTQSHVVDLAMADNSQAFSPSGSLLPAANVLASSEIGIIPFKWMRNPGIWTTNASNVTDSQIRQALAGGTKLAVFTGNVSDTNNYVYVAGRDNGSGTRVNAFGDCGFGSSTAPGQIEINSDGTLNSTISHSVHTYTQDWGQSSGGGVATELGINTATATDANKSKTGYAAIGYVGYADAVTALANGATELAYNGIRYANTNIYEGTYTYWGNEYVLETANTYTGQSTQVGNAYADMTSPTTGITSQADGILLIPLNAMHCTRTGPGSDPAHN